MGPRSKKPLFWVMLSFICLEDVAGRYVESSSWILNNSMQQDNYKHTVSEKHFIYKADLTAQAAFLAGRSRPAPVRPGELRLQPGRQLYRRDPLKGGVIDDVPSGLLPWVALNLCCYLLPFPA